MVLLKRDLPLEVELLSVITRLKYKSGKAGYDTLFSSSITQKTLKVHTYPSVVDSRPDALILLGYIAIVFPICNCSEVHYMK